MIRAKNKGQQCSEPGCSHEAYSLGLCHKHYHANRRHEAGAGNTDAVGGTFGVESKGNHGIERGGYFRHVAGIVRDMLGKDLGVDLGEWMLNEFRLPQSEGVDGGKITFDGYPWIPHILKMAQNPQVRRINLCQSAQSSKTVVLFGIASFLAARKGRTGLYAFPTQKLQKKVPKTRMIPCFERSPGVEYMGREDMILRFGSGAYIWVALMSAPDSMAEMPAGWVIADELDELDNWETDAVELMENRLTTSRSPLMVLGSTPKLLDENGIYHRYKNSKRYAVETVCPGCEDGFRIRFPDHFRWTEGISWQEVEDGHHGWVECPRCQFKIKDEHHRDVVYNRQKIVDLDPDKPVTVIGYHVRRWETKWKNYSEVIAKYLQVKDDESKLKDFWNSWCAEPRDMQIRGIRVNYRKLRGDWVRDARQVPSWVQVVTAGVDLGDGEAWVVLLGWGARNRVAPFWSCKLESDERGDEGVRDLLLKLDEVCNMDQFEYLGEGVHSVPGFIGGCIDCGYGTQVVYDFSRESDGVWMAAKGGGPARLYELRAADPQNRRGGKYRGLNFYLHNTHQLQEIIQLRLETKAGRPGGIEFAGDEGARFFKHLDAVSRRVVRENGREKYKWDKKSKNSEDHLRDALGNAELAGRIAEVPESLTEQIPLAEIQEPKAERIYSDLEEPMRGGGFMRS